MFALRARHVAAAATLTLIASLAGLPVAAQDDPLTCLGRDVTIEASPGIPTIGTADSDVILGTAGADVIHGRGGDDVICGLSGGDTITGGPGSDLIDGGDGHDDLAGGPGADAITGGRGRDTMRGGKGGDDLRGGGRADEIAGNAGNDRLDGGIGPDALDGGRGRDALAGGPGHDALDGGPGNDTNDGGVGRDRCVSGEGPAVDARCLEGLELTLIADLDERAGLVLAPPGDDTRLFVIEQYHGIRVIEDGTLLPEPFLDLTSKVSKGNEQGVLGMAFHPDYAQNGRFFVSYTTRAGHNKVVRYRVDPENPNLADAASNRLILQVDQPHRWHNGGHIAFGPDGYLYVGIGDGGPANDPDGTGQDTGNLLSGISRIDVDVPGPDRYGVPDDNPFVGTEGADELWAYGLRNPWRFSFDAATDRIYIGDVGQYVLDEINVAPASEGGINYGWSEMEGNACFGGSFCDRTGLHEPLVPLPHVNGLCAVVGGSVYRGAAIPELDGHYLYGDFCTRRLTTFLVAGGEATQTTTWLTAPADTPAAITLVHEPPPGGVPAGSITSFGVDNDGELYVATLGGAVYRIDPVR